MSACSYIKSRYLHGLIPYLYLSLPVTIACICVSCDAAAALYAPPWRDSGATQLREREGDAGKKQWQKEGRWRAAVGTGGGLVIGRGFSLENPVKGRVASVCWAHHVSAALSTQRGSVRSQEAVFFIVCITI